MAKKAIKAEVLLAEPNYGCSAGSADSEYRALLTKVRSNPIVLAGAVYGASDHYRCYVVAEKILNEHKVCFETADISDELWSYLKCLYPKERVSSGMMMHSYLYIGGEMVGNGFVMDRNYDQRYTWDQLHSKMISSNAKFSCGVECDSLLDEASRNEISKLVAERPVVMYGWESCPCVATARTS